MSGSYCMAIFPSLQCANHWGETGKALKCESENDMCMRVNGAKACKAIKSASAVIFLIMVSAVVVMAQDGKAGIQKADSEVRGYFGVGTNLMYAIGAVVGLIGAVKVYQKWNSGDQDTSKVAAAWFGSCIFLVVVSTIIKSFFGIA